MTRNERLTAFVMRLDGKSWAEIGEVLGYSAGAVFKDLRSCLEGAARSATCVYPALAAVLKEDFQDSIRDFSEEVGVSYNTAYNILTGRTAPGRYGPIIAQAAGLPEDIAFEREEL